MNLIKTKILLVFFLFISFIAPSFSQQGPDIPFNGYICQMCEAQNHGTRVVPGILNIVFATYPELGISGGLQSSTVIAGMYQQRLEYHYDSVWRDPDYFCDKWHDFNYGGAWTVPLFSNYEVWATNDIEVDVQVKVAVYYDNYLISKQIVTDEWYQGCHVGLGDLTGSWFLGYPGKSVRWPEAWQWALSPEIFQDKNHIQIAPFPSRIQDPEEHTTNWQVAVSLGEFAPEGYHIEILGAKINFSTSWKGYSRALASNYAKIPIAGTSISLIGPTHEVFVMEEQHDEQERNKEVIVGDMAPITESYFEQVHVDVSFTMLPFPGETFSSPPPPPIGGGDNPGGPPGGVIY